MDYIQLTAAHEGKTLAIKTNFYVKGLVKSYWKSVISFKSVDDY